MQQPENYEARFSPQPYIQTHYADLKNNEALLQSYHEFYSRFNSEWNADSAALLEFSGGPVIAFLVSAAPHVETIVFSAYTEQERREVSQWKHDMKGAYDWCTYFEYVVQHLEGQARSCQEERKRMLRQKISKIIECA